MLNIDGCGCCGSFLRKGRPPSLGNTLRVRRDPFCPLHTRRNLQENPTTCRESLQNVILECESSVNWKSQLPKGYSCSSWERNVKKVRKVIFFEEGFRFFWKKLQDLILPSPSGGLAKWGWALPDAFTWFAEGIALPHTFPTLIHMHFLEEMALLRWNGHVLAGYCLFFIASMVG